MPDTAAKTLSALKRTIETEREGMLQLENALDQAAVDVVDLIGSVEGRLACVGVGKSGHVARKIAATLASTGRRVPSEPSIGANQSCTKWIQLLMSNSS